MHGAIANRGLLLDDYKWSAHKALTGKDDIGTEASLMQADQQKPLLEVIETYLGGACHKFSDTVDLDNPQAASCSPFMTVGFDKAGCKGANVSCKPILRRSTQSNTKNP